MTVFRPYAEGDALRSDRSAGDRKRHRDKLRRSIRDNIADIIAEESIIGRDRDRIVKVPIRGIKEYRFVFGDNEGGVGAGEGGTEPGQVVGKAGQKPGQGQGQGPGGNEPGADIYETEITLDELVDIMFEDLELPDLERKILKEALSERVAKRLGYRKQGVRAHLDRKRTVKERLKRQIATGNVETLRAEAEGGAPAERFPFRRGDLTYRRLRVDTREESNAVVICIMDTSGSMDRLKKYLARSFFFLLYQFVRTRYQNTELVFIGHHTKAKEVDEDEFFHKGESGGTLISSGYQKALEIVRDRFHPAHWNIYAFHCSDGDNFDSDNAEALKAARELCDTCNLFGYGEIKPMGSHYYESSMIDRFRKLEAPNFQSVLIERREDIWPAFKAFMSKDRVAGES
ncbi:MAG: sporulation protein YhbH [Geminicoccaceae bacterium]|nr:sporulation protein YhbH [Geminicoccaceae bacterium]